MSAVIYQCFKLSFATLYPAYASYKAVKTKNVKDYVKWMMYWVVYAFFVTVEVIADIFVTWLPFYYELKIVFVLWLLSPTTKGSSIMYRKLIHPQLARRESEIDNYIDKASDQGYSALLALGSRAVTMATNVILASAIRGQTKLVDHLQTRSSHSNLGGIDSQDGGGDDASQNGGEESRSRTDSVVSESDEQDNEILRECYRQEMAEKRARQNRPNANAAATDKHSD